MWTTTTELPRHGAIVIGDELHLHLAIGVHVDRDGAITGLLGDGAASYPQRVTHHINKIMSQHSTQLTD